LINKNILSQYVYLKKEKEDLEVRINKDRQRLRKIEEEGPVIDSVACGRKGKKPIRTVKIAGFPHGEYDKRKAMLNARISILERYKNEILETEMKVEEYIQSIDDSRIRLIIRYKYLDNLGWDQVAAKMGGYNTADSVRKMMERYLSANDNLSTMSEKNIL
jgi:hypothetical protein